MILYQVYHKIYGFSILSENFSVFPQKKIGEKKGATPRNAVGFLLYGSAPLQGGERKSIRRREDGGKGCVLLIHRGAVPLSRYGSGTLGLFHSPGVKFTPLVPLRYRQEKARTGEGKICLLRWEKVAANG